MLRILIVKLVLRNSLYVLQKTEYISCTMMINGAGSGINQECAPVLRLLGEKQKC
jgi:hypothetical protein